MANEGTPLGYGAAVLPGGFDPLRFQQGLNEFLLQEQQRKKVAAADKLKMARESVNPELDKTKWASAYSNYFSPKFKNFQNESIQKYAAQEGKLTADQIFENRRFKDEYNADVELFNTLYKEFQDAQKTVVTNPKYNTDANTKEIQRYRDPWTNDKETIAKYDNPLEYFVDNPLSIEPKAEDFNIIQEVDDIWNLAGTAQYNLQPYTDPLSGKVIFPTSTAGRPERAAAIAQQRYLTNPGLKEIYPTLEEFQKAVALGEPAKKIEEKVVKPEVDRKPAAVTLSFGAGTTGETKAVETSKTIRSGQPGLGRFTGLFFEGLPDKDVPAPGFAIKGPKGKDINVSGFVNNLFTLDDNQLVTKEGDQINMKVSEVRALPIATNDIDVGPIAPGALKDDISNIIKNNVIPANTLLSEKELNALANLGFTDNLQYRKFVFGDVSRITPQQVREGVVLPKKGPSGRFIAPFEDLAGQLEASGFTWKDDIPIEPGAAEPTPTPTAPAENLGEIVEQGGFRYRRNPETGGYDLIEQAQEEKKKITEPPTERVGDGSISQLPEEDKSPIQSKEGGVNLSKAEIKKDPKKAEISGKAVKEYSKLDINSKTFEKFKKFEGFGYSMSERGGVKDTDCSSLVCRMYGIDFKGVSSEDIYRGPTTKNKKENTPIKDLKDGDLIFLDTGETSFDKKRKLGIDHVGVIVKDSKTGTVYIAENANGEWLKGTGLSLLSDRLKSLKSQNALKKYYTAEVKK